MAALPVFSVTAVFPRCLHVMIVFLHHHNLHLILVAASLKSHAVSDAIVGSLSMSLVGVNAT